LIRKLPLTWEKHEPRRRWHGLLHGDGTARLRIAGAGRHMAECGMTHIQVVRVKKLTGKNIIEVAARHNHREIASERGADSHISTERIGLNSVLRGDETAAGVANMAQALLDNAGVKTLRKDSVRALEIIFCLPPESSINHVCFFRDALGWTDEYFQAPVISAVIHCDEAAPHCHVLVLPLVHGRMIGSDLMGNRAKLQAMHADFHGKVGQRHGLTRHVTPRRLSASVRRLAIETAFELLEANSGLNPDVLKALLAPHLQSPESLLLALGLEMPKPKTKGTFVGIMTKPTKPERKQKPIGFDEVSGPKKEQTLSLCRVPISASPISPTSKPQKALPPESKTGNPSAKESTADTIADIWARQRDDSTPSEEWQDGEHCKPQATTSARRQAAEQVRATVARRTSHTIH
jgi:hypothetical protein